MFKILIRLSYFQTWFLHWKVLELFFLFKIRRLLDSGLTNIGQNGNFCEVFELCVVSLIDLLDLLFLLYNIFVILPN